MVHDITKDVSLHLGSLQSFLASDFCPIHGQSESELKMPESQGSLSPLLYHSGGSPAHLLWEVWQLREDGSPRQDTAMVPMIPSLISMLQRQAHFTQTGKVICDSEH